MTSDDKHNIHIVVAAGSGSRYGGNLPKQFLPLHGRPMLMTTLERLDRAAPGAETIVVLSHDMRDTWQEMCREHGFSLPHRIVDGGPSRAHSVKNAIDSIKIDNIGWISVHDAARPLVTPGMVDRLISAIDAGASGAIPAVPVTDSIRLVGDDGVSSVAVDRSRYRAVQTPQIFDGPTLIAAYDRELLPTFTDDASVMEAAGHHDLRLVEGDAANIKVTNPGDMERIEAYLKS